MTNKKDDPKTANPATTPVAESSNPLASLLATVEAAPKAAKTGTTGKRNSKLFQSSVINGQYVCGFTIYKRKWIIQTPIDTGIVTLLSADEQDKQPTGGNAAEPNAKTRFTERQYPDFNSLFGADGPSSELTKKLAPTIRKQFKAAKTENVTVFEDVNY